MDILDTAAARREARLLRAGASLWAAVREGDAPAEDTRAALDAIRYSLDCARRVRAAAPDDPQTRHTRKVEAALAAEALERLLLDWGVSRGLIVPEKDFPALPSTEALRR